jgi:hypothetical protein
MSLLIYALASNQDNYTFDFQKELDVISEKVDSMTGKG